MSLKKERREKKKKCSIIHGCVQTGPRKPRTDGGAAATEEPLLLLRNSRVHDPCVAENRLYLVIMGGWWVVGRRVVGRRVGSGGGGPCSFKTQKAEPLTIQPPEHRNICTD